MVKRKSTGSAMTGIRMMIQKTSFKTCFTKISKVAQSRGSVIFLRKSRNTSTSRALVAIKISAGLSWSRHTPEVIVVSYLKRFGLVALISRIIS